MAEFQRGQVYQFSEWYTGGWQTLKVKDISDDHASIVFHIYDEEPDGTFERDESYEVHLDEEGEFVQVYSDGGIIRAESPKEDLDTLGLNDYEAEKAWYGDNSCDPHDGGYSDSERDYGPSNPWDAPGMSVRDFI